MAAWTISIRDATIKDLDATSEIVSAESGENTVVWRERFAAVLADPSRHFLVATSENCVVGFGHTRFIVREREPGAQLPPDGWYLSGMTVTSTARRRGIGTQLTVARLDRLREVAECVFYVAEQENAATLELHHRLGFFQIGTIRLPEHDRDMILERLNLSPFD